MAREDPSVILLTEQNIELASKLREAERTIGEQDKRIMDLRAALARPAIAVFNEGQIDLLAEFLYQLMADRIDKPPLVN